MGESIALTLKQETFAQAYFETGNASEAYRRSYNAVNTPAEQIHVRAHEVLHNRKVAVRVEELRQRQIRKYHVSLDALTHELEEIRIHALKNGKYSTAVSAIMGIARLHGLDVQQAKVTVKHETSPQERMAILQSLLSRTAFADKNSAPQL